MNIKEKTKQWAYLIDIQFLIDKYGFDKKTSSELIGDILKGNFESTREDKGNE